MEKDELRQALHLGKIAQVGFVVRDLSQSIKNYQEIIGIGTFTTLELRPEKAYMLRAGSSYPCHCILG